MNVNYILYSKIIYNQNQFYYYLFFLNLSNFYHNKLSMFLMDYILYQIFSIRNFFMKLKKIISLLVEVNVKYLH